MFENSNDVKINKIYVYRGDHMVEQMQYLEAVTHFIEAGENMKAVQAAIMGRQWSRALEIVEQQRDDNNPEIAKYYKQLGNNIYSCIL